MNNPLLKYLSKTTKKDVMHTSAYAQAQNKDGMGASSTRSFTERMRVERNRQRIQGYNSSRLVSQTFAVGPRAKTYEAPAKEERGIMGARETAKQMGSAVVPNRERFNKK